MSSSALTFDDDAAAHEHCRANVTVFDVSSVVQEWQEWVSKLAEARFRPPPERQRGDFHNYCVSFMQACGSGNSMLVLNDDVRFEAYAMGPVTHFQIETCSEFFIVWVVFDNDLRVDSERIKLAFYRPHSHFVMECMDNPSTQVRLEGVWRLSPMIAYAGIPRSRHAFKEIPFLMRKSSSHVDAARKAMLITAWNDLANLRGMIGKFASCEIDYQGIPQLHRTATREDQVAQSDASEIDAATSFQAASARQAQRRTQRLRQDAEALSLFLSHSSSSFSSLSLPSTAAAPELVVCQPFMCKLMYKQMQELEQDNMCSICLEDTTEDTHRVLSCGHFLCSGCMGNLIDWKCPQCCGNIRK